MVAGIYQIWNQKTGERYIGASVDATNTLNWYIESFGLGRKVKLAGLNLEIYNNLAADWEKYGEKSFVWEILEVTPHNQMLLKERKLFWCRALLPSYNMAHYLPLACGVYQVVNKKTKQLYVGQSNDIWGRWRQHRSHLNANKHHNINLQKSWSQWGADCFNFEILEECFPNKLILLALEQHWISRLKPEFNVKA